MPKYYLVNLDRGEVMGPIEAWERPRAEGDLDIMNTVQAAAFTAGQSHGGSVEGVTHKDGTVYCLGCIPDDMTEPDVDKFIFDDTPDEWVCDTCGNRILDVEDEGPGVEVKPMTLMDLVDYLKGEPGDADA